MSVRVTPGSVNRSPIRERQVEKAIGAMDSRARATEVRAAFQELGLSLGGIFLHHPSTEDDVVWAIARVVSRAFQRTMKSISDADTPVGSEFAPTGQHPAILSFLEHLSAS